MDAGQLVQGAVGAAASPRQRPRHAEVPSPSDQRLAVESDPLVHHRRRRRPARSVGTHPRTTVDDRRVQGEVEALGPEWGAVRKGVSVSESENESRVDSKFSRPRAIRYETGTSYTERRLRTACCMQFHHLEAHPQYCITKILSKHGVRCYWNLGMEIEMGMGMGNGTKRSRH